MITQDQLVDYLKNVPLGDLNSLITRLEDELGVKASAPQMFIPQQGNPTDPDEDKTDFDVVLTDFGSSKIGVIKEVRKITGMGLKDAKALVEETPATLKEAIPKEQADEIAEALRAIGATVEVK